MILSKRTVRRMKQMRACDPVRWNITTLSKLFGCSYETARRQLEPEFAERKNKERRASNRYVIITQRPIEDEELRRRRALIPMDVRDVTSRLMGDPIPGDPRRRATG
jgi:hypothetical protein